MNESTLEVGNDASDAGRGDKKLEPPPSTSKRTELNAGTSYSVTPTDLSHRLTEVQGWEGASRAAPPGSEPRRPRLREEKRAGGLHTQPRAEVEADEAPRRLVRGQKEKATKPPREKERTGEGRPFRRAEMPFLPPTGKVKCLKGPGSISKADECP